jgi:hypothetical protein
MGMLTRRRRRGTDDPSYDDERRYDDGTYDGRTTRESYTDDRAPARESYDDGSAPATVRRAPAAASAPAAAAATRPRWHDPTRALATLGGVAIAGFLAWLTTRIGGGSNGGYWAEYGILAGAGLVMAFSQLVGGWTKWGRPRLSPLVFLLAFVPTLIAVGWIMGFHQPDGNWFRAHVVSWSGDIGIDSFVQDMGGALLTMLGFGLGLVFGLSFDTSGARRTDAAVPTYDRNTADEPLTREREVVRS